ncbi:IS3 family transposase [Mycobacterium intracellulare]|uniref:IS3 family transposase n=1 Tax=Mycobacterium intracellulare TaxID=1767 RepID=UPI001E5F71E0|nr:IS3 family transposase [Mycobacterium intracellulare]
MPRQYPPEFRQRALRLLDTMMEASDVSEFEAIKSVASKLGIAQESVRRWRRKAQVDAGERPGTTGSEHAEIRRLKRENAELRRANEVLKSASAFFGSGARPPRDEMIAFIDAHRDQFGVELICRVLRAAIPGFLTSRGYRAARTRPPSDREIRDEQLIADLREVHRKNYSVYGVLKMHQAMKRKGWVVGREQTRRLMRKAGLRGAQRGKLAFTTITDPAAVRPADLVNRQFRAAAPNRLWVADITFVRTWQGFCYTAFVTDACTRKIVGWAVSATMRTEDLPLQAFNHAVWQSNTDLSELIHHSDRGSQYLSLAYTDRLAELGIAPSVGSRGDSYDNALAEAVNAAYKSELITRGRPWRYIDDVELSTAAWVAWYNQERLHEALGYLTPAEYEAALTGTSHPASQPTPALATE